MASLHPRQVTPVCRLENAVVNHADVQQQRLALPNTSTTARMGIRVQEGEALVNVAAV